MSNILILFFSLALGFTSPSENDKSETQENNVTTYYLIRHAEKDRSDSENQDPKLTEEGMARAKNWANVLKDVEFDAVYSTNYKRTVRTASPLAIQNNLEILKYDSNMLYDLDFQKKTKAKTVMVVGHSNTTPQFANAILQMEKYQNIDDSENGALFIIEVYKDGSLTSKVLYIN